MYGTSTEYILKQYYKVLSNGYKPDLVLILFFRRFSRRDYLRDDGEYRRIGGWRRSYDPNDTIFRDDKEDLLLTLQNDYQDLHIFWNSYKFVEQMNKNFNIPTFHSVQILLRDFSNPHEQDSKFYRHGNFFLTKKDCYQNDMTGKMVNIPS